MICTPGGSVLISHTTCFGAAGLVTRAGGGSPLPVRSTNTIPITDSTVAIVTGISSRSVSYTHLSRDITRKIEEEATYPGQVRVCVIRETRSTDYAR